jgi:hypothetical protein
MTVLSSPGEDGGGNHGRHQPQIVNPSAGSSRVVVLK